MARITAYGPLNTVNPEVWYGYIAEATDTRIVVTDGYDQDIYHGYGFEYLGEQIVGGTLTALQQFSGDWLQGEITGFAVPAPLASDYIGANRLTELLAIIMDGDDEIYGSAHTDFIATFGGNDVVHAGAGHDYIYTGATGWNQVDGGEGIDTAFYDDGWDEYSIDGSPGYLTVEGSGFTDELVSVERLSFEDSTLAFDDHAIQMYRLYQAAFDRTPETEGVSYWVGQIDAGLSFLDTAAGFIDSSEFASLYGSNPANEEFIDLLYLNVFDRAADEGGYSFWNNAMAEGTSRAEVLSNFSESDENQANTAWATENGVWLDPIDHWHELFG